ncbi:hypothetical protein ACEK06_22570 [Pseudomonas brenneri]
MKKRQLRLLNAIIISIGAVLGVIGAGMGIYVFGCVLAHLAT